MKEGQLLEIGPPLPVVPVRLLVLLVLVLVVSGLLSRPCVVIARVQFNVHQRSER